MTERFTKASLVMIQVFSSYANDIITYQDNAIISGGPALWIEQTFNDLAIDYALHTGSASGIVRIEKDGNNEDRWFIVSTSGIPFSRVGTWDVILVSTLKQEFDLMNLWNCENDIFIDIQWFLRGDTGKKNIFDCETLQSEGHVYIKATREEYGYLINTSQPHLTFVITNWANPIEIITKGKLELVPVSPGEFADTIGAWDTFLAGLVYFFTQMRDLEKAVLSASDYVFSFLRKKNNLL